MSKAAIVGLSALLLVGLVVALTSVATDWIKAIEEEAAGVNTSTKPIQAICQPTDYKETCFKSLSNVNSNDPKELVKAAFQSAKNEISTNVAKSKLLEELEKKPETSEAVKDCRELFRDSMDDLERSFNEIGSLEVVKMKELLGNLKSWLSASITYQETCLDGFEKTTGDASVKVRTLLETSMQMCSNGLAIVNDLSSLIGTIDFSSFNRRRLLSLPIRHDFRRMDNEDKKRLYLNKIGKNRRLVKDSDDANGDEEKEQRKLKLLSMNDDDELPGDWFEGSRREVIGGINILDDLKVKANIVVAQHGSGKYKTIEDALKDVPINSKDPYIIYIKEGIYNEYLSVEKSMQHLVFVGDGPTKTRITNNHNFVHSTKTFKTATLSVLGDFFMAKDIGFENSAGAIKHQAVALRVQSDQSIFFNCHMDGYQDTLYAHTYRQFYRDCRITGTIDFIFGNAAAFFQNCTFVVRKPLDNQQCIVTAQGRTERHQASGIIIHRCRFEGDPEYMPLKDKNRAFLGRPWKEYSNTIIMESFIDIMIAPEGWLPWEGNFGLDTSYYGEYMNQGPGSVMTQRVKWPSIKTIAHTRAEKFMPRYLFETDAWIVDSHIPYEPDMFAPAPGLDGATGKNEDPNAPTPQPIESASSSSLGSSSGSNSNSVSLGSLSSDSSGAPTSVLVPVPILLFVLVPVPAPSLVLAPALAPIESPSASPQNSATSSNSLTQLSPQVASSHLSRDMSLSSTINESPETNKIRPISMKELERMLLENEEIEEATTLLFVSSSPDISSSENTAQNKIGSVSMKDLGRMLMENVEVKEAPTLSFIPAPAPASIGSPLTPSQSITTSVDSSAQVPIQDVGLNSSPDMSSSPKQNKIGSVSLKELERMLMENEEIEEGEEEEPIEVMSINVLDVDEFSPAPSPAEPLEIIISISGPSDDSNPSPSDDEFADWLPPATAPELDQVEVSDKLSQVSPPPNSSATCIFKYEFSIILTGLAILASLVM